MINIKIKNGKVTAKGQIIGSPADLAEITIAATALGEILHKGIEQVPEFGRKVKADCIKAFTMAANGSGKAEIAEAITGKKY